MSRHIDLCGNTCPMLPCININFQILFYILNMYSCHQIKHGILCITQGSHGEWESNLGGETLVLLQSKCNHVFKGRYTRVWHHLLFLSGEEVKGCTCDLEKRMELTKLHMGALGASETDLNNARPFKVPKLVPSSHEREDSVN
jgi:hypothetical protein